jgi:hypothetical protein
MIDETITDTDVSNFNVYAVFGKVFGNRTSGATRHDIFFKRYEQAVAPREVANKISV